MAVINHHHTSVFAHTHNDRSPILIPKKINTNLHKHEYTEKKRSNHSPHKLTVKKSFTIHAIKTTADTKLAHPLDEDTLSAGNNDENEYDDEDEYTYDSSDDYSFSSCSSQSTLSSPNDSTSPTKLIPDRKFIPSESNSRFSFHSFNNDRYSYSSQRSIISIPVNKSPCSCSSSVTSASSVSPPTSIVYQSRCTPITSTVSTTCQQPSSMEKSTSTDSLYKILQKSTPIEKKSMYSNLTTSIKNWKTKLSSNKDNLLRVILDSPRLTDDKLPTTITVHPPQELITFNKQEPQVNTNCITLKPNFKNRDQRINSEFLRLYAFDYNARIKSMTLPHNGNQEELIKLVQSNPSLRQFHYQYNIYRVSCMSRDKLWNSVILPPRSDESPTWEIDPAEYVFRGKEDDDDLNYSIIRKEGKYLPWDSIMKPSIKPAGVLPKGRCIFNGMAPNSGVTKTQFTVKGWCNSRWVDCSQEE